MSLLRIADFGLRIGTAPAPTGRNFTRRRRARSEIHNPKWPVLTALILALCASIGFGQPPPTLRIWLAKAPAEPAISCDGPCTILPLGGKTEGRLLLKLEPVKVSLTKGGFRVGKTDYLCKTIEFRPEKDRALRLGGCVYAGSLRIIRAQKRIAVINVVPVEHYLLGVLPSEMPASWPAEALKAQAVAARTYALYHGKARTGMLWDMTSTVEDQVYRGGVAPRSIVEAVSQTRGEVLMHGGAVIPAFFHSTCGGRTEKPSIALAKPGCDFIGVRTCTFCKDSAHYRWRRWLSAKALAARLAGLGVKPESPITRIAVVVPEGQPGWDVLIEWQGGRAEVPIVDFRRAVGRMEVKSGRFKCFPVDDGFFFYGNGLGHGAGMCQYGARGMAKLGKTYQEILRFYYQNTEVKRVY